MEEKKREEKKVISMDDLEKVTGGSLKNAVTEEPKPISQDTKKNI